MATLAKIVGSIAARVDKPFDVDLQKELKHIIGYKRSNYTQQFLQKHPEQRKFFLQKLTVELEKVPSDECEPIKGCEILRTKCVMPKPVRTSQTLFDFVGTSTFTAGYGYQEPEFISTVGANRFTGKKPKWHYSDGRIYIYNTTTIERIGVRGVFEVPSAVNACACDPVDCLKDTDEYPIALDLLNSIVRDTLSVEMRQPVLPTQDVEIDALEEMENRGMKPTSQR